MTPFVGGDKSGVTFSDDPKAGLRAATDKRQTITAPENITSEWTRQEGWPARLVIQSGGKGCSFVVMLRYGGG